MIDHSRINKGAIRTTDACKGCNKCIGACPVSSANIAVEQEDGGSRVYIDQEKCILCGKCMDACTHDARVFSDDTDRFFEDLGTGRGISVVIAPAFIINYPQKYRMVLGYLKSLGVKHIYSVSAGADITIWAYVNYMKANRQNGIISQPCPAIVNYIEQHRPELLERLIPVQSPVMCTAIYLQEYLGITDDLAFLSPCIAKKMELEREENAGRIKYNVTFSHLMDTIGGTDISDYYADDSEIDYGLGALFSTQGGLRENIEYYLGLDKNAYVNQKEGEVYSYSYLDLYAARVDYEDPYRAQLIDILNCARGCNYGTATEFKNTTSNHIPYFTNRMRVKKLDDGRELPRECGEELDVRLQKMNERFGDLDIQDFMHSYENRYQQEGHVTKGMLYDVFQKMLKFTKDDREIDCNNCGYHSCEHMAKAVALGYNHVDNCVDYVKKRLVLEQSEAEHQKLMLEELREEHAEDAENMDQLTGLQNRYGMEEKLDQVLRKARMQGQVGHVFMVDLDDFASINKSYGHNYGNELLTEFARFLKKQFSDTASIFRIGGDEFSLVLENSTAAKANDVAQKILDRTRAAWQVMGTRFYCTASIGMARFPIVDEGVDGIIKNADLAVHIAKNGGKDDFVVYDQQLDTNSSERIELIRQMRDCIANDFARFEVYYQPWISAEGKIIGVESLLRWRDEDGNFVSPGKFIPIAEQEGLILQLGEFVLKEAVSSCKKINRVLPDFMFSVNVSVKQFNHPDVFDTLFGIVQEAGVRPKNIVLEITESLGVESLSRQKQIMGRFAEAGMRVALDDFGTGYSSLSYLNELPLNLVKIDRSFIRNIDSNAYSKDFLTTMAELIHKTGQKVCVEGVETETQLGYCRQACVDIIQGFYYYRPMPFGELEEVLEEARDAVQ